MGLAVLTLFTLCAFAANSLLCRAALGGGLIDPASFTTIRLTSGALALLCLSRVTREPDASSRVQGSWLSGLALFGYAACFSQAYVSLSTGMGALILFGTVQASMIAAALQGGERLGFVQWLGCLSAIGGLSYLLWPDVTAPDPLGAGMMIVAGLSWTVYSLRGKNVVTPVAMTTGNFVRSAPFGLVISVLTFSSFSVATRGVVLAMISGAVTSGLGYVLWYRLLRRITTAQASVLQLAVPVFAAFAGILLLGERLTWRLAIGSVVILGGVALAALCRKRSF